MEETMMGALEQFKVNPTPTENVPEPATTAEVTPPVETEPQPEPAPAFDPSTWLKEQTAGRFQSWQDVEAELNKPVPQPEPLQFPNEVSKTLHEALASGNFQEVADYVKKTELAASVKDKTPEDLIKIGWKTQYGLTDSEAERRFQKMYSVDDLLEDEDKSIEQKLKAKEIEEEANKYKTFFQQFEQEIKLPTVQQPVPASTVDLDSDEAKQALAFAQSLNRTLPTEYSNIPFEFSDPNANINLKGQVVIPQDKLNEIKTQLAGHEEKVILSRWVNADGSINSDQFAYDIYRLTHENEIGKAIASDVYNQTRIELLKQNRNHQSGPTPSADFQPSNEEQNVSWFNQFFKVPV